MHKEVSPLVTCREVQTLPPSEIHDVSTRHHVSSRSAPDSRALRKPWLERLECQLSHRSAFSLTFDLCPQPGAKLGIEVQWYLTSSPAKLESERIPGLEGDHEDGMHLFIILGCDYTPTPLPLSREQKNKN